MADNPHLQGLLGVHTLHTRHVVGDLSSALTEAHHTVVKEGTRVAVGGIGVAEPCLMEGKEEGGMINARAYKYKCKQRHAPRPGT